jgi:hypothetical protein
MHKKEAGGKKQRYLQILQKKIRRKVMMHYCGVSGQGFGQESDES